MFEVLIYVVAVCFLIIVGLGLLYYIVIVPNRFHQLQIFLDQNLYDEAEILLSDILKKEPNNYSMMFHLGELYWTTNKKQDAVSMYEKLFKHQKSLSIGMQKTMLFRLAEYQYQNGSIDQSKDFLKTLLEIDQKNPTYLSLYGDILFKQNNHNKALQYYQKAVSYAPTDLHSWLQTATIHYETEQYNDAYRAYSRVVHIENNNPMHWFNIGKISELMGDRKKALNFYAKVEKFSNPALTFQVLMNSAQIYKDTEEIPFYIMTLEKAKSLIKGNPHDLFEQEKILDLQYQLGDYYLSDNSLELAITEWESIVALEKNYRDVPIQLEKHRNLQLDDFFKDILTHTGDELIEILAVFVRSLGFTVDSIQNYTDEGINVHVSENSAKWRDVRRRKTLISFWCSTDPIPIDIILRLTTQLAKTGVSQMYLITAGPVFSEMRQILERKSADIYDRNNIQELISARKKSIATNQV